MPADHVPAPIELERGRRERLFSRGEASGSRQRSNLIVTAELVSASRVYSGLRFLVSGEPGWAWFENPSLRGDAG